MAAIDLRYARALASVVDDQKMDRLAVQQQLSDFVATLDDSPQLREVLGDPSIPEQQKLKVLDAVATKAGLSSPVRNFVALVTRHERLQALPEMVAAYARLADEESSVAEAEIVSAHTLDEGNRRLLEEQIAKLTGGQRVRATYSEDETLLGGAVVKVGSTVYDGSVRAQLEQLKRRLVAAGAH